MDHFSRSFDIEGMLSDNAVWLTLQVGLPVSEFVDIANKLELRPQDWSEFWKKTSNVKVKDKTPKANIECVILGKEWTLTQEEFEFVEDLLGCATEEVSNCCGAEILEPVVNHTARCPECKEGCGVVYVWGTTTTKTEILERIERLEREVL